MKENPEWLKQDLFQNIFEQKYGKQFRIKSFMLEKVDDPWDKTVNYRVQIETEFKMKKSSIFGCGSKKFEESLSYLLRMSPEKEIEMYDKVIPALEKLYAEKNKKVKFSEKPKKIYHDKVLLFEDYKSTCMQKIRDFSEKDLEAVLKKIAEFHAASAVYANDQSIDNFIIKAAESEDILDIFSRKVKPTIIEKCEDGEYFADKFFSDTVNDKYDSKEFNVLNHGQCWSNNILFGNDDIYFINYQLPNFGSPAHDLYFFLLSATNINDKTKKFDYFIKYYYDNLVDNLKLLGYKKEIPYLTDLRMSLIRHGIWARIAVCGVVSTSLSNEKVDLYTNEQYVSVLRDLLPWMDNRGLLEHKNPPHVALSQIEQVGHVEVKTSEIIEESIKIQNTLPESKVPSWINAEYFEEIVKKEMGGFSRITKLTSDLGKTVGENYAPLQLRINIEAELQGVGKYNQETIYSNN